MTAQTGRAQAEGLTLRNREGLLLRRERGLKPMPGVAPVLDAVAPPPFPDRLCREAVVSGNLPGQLQARLDRGYFFIHKVVYFGRWPE